ncbi:hypothetical protein PTTG_29366 [Puccinia triticina 1-1 BBBD Race 1]|uniref:Retrotransposon gag domain-containing protein n=1 Tax=Puccinia triticina (isolate 1-1 / race 1 (BBBD)) TaxID=630390 RepID=A0A180G4U0_PUCT1|nr:hypothetical protein PTTG_29366 [Puccinia triticina 1-1 BBBD Race 1]
MAKICTNQPVTYAEFTSTFESMYYNTEKELGALKQTKLVAHYTHQFVLNAHNLGWEAGTLISQYQQGLKREVRLALVILRVQFTTLDEVTNLALPINNELSGLDTSGANSNATPDPNAMDLSAFCRQPVSNEKARMMHKGLSFKCGQQGHIARGYPGKGKGKAPAKISKLKEELQLWKSGAKRFGKGSGKSKNGAARD